MASIDRDNNLLAGYLLLWWGFLILMIFFSFVFHSLNIDSKMSLSWRSMSCEIWNSGGVCWVQALRKPQLCDCLMQKCQVNFRTRFHYKEQFIFPERMLSVPMTWSLNEVVAKWETLPKFYFRYTICLMVCVNQPQISLMPFLSNLYHF